MPFKKRLLVIASLCIVAVVFYGVAKHYSSLLIFYVVEQSLIQKAPPGIDRAVLRERFRAFVSAAPDEKSRMEKLLRIAEYLEKVQHLSSKQLTGLLTAETT